MLDVEVSEQLGGPEYLPKGFFRSSYFQGKKSQLEVKELLKFQALARLGKTLRTAGKVNLSNGFLFPHQTVLIQNPGRQGFLHLRVD